MKNCFQTLTAFGLATIVVLVSTTPVMAASKPKPIPTTATYGQVSSLTGNQLLMTVGKKMYTITLSSTTVFENAKARIRTVTEITTSHKVWVWGKKNEPKLTITSVSKVKDMSVTK